MKRRPSWIRRRVVLLSLVAFLVAAAASACGRQPASDVSRPVDTQGWHPLSGEIAPRGDDVAILGYPDGQPLASRKVVLATDPPVVLGPTNGTAREFAWMPDGEHVLISYGEELSSEAPNRYAIVDRDGTVTREITPSRPHFSEAAPYVLTAGDAAYISASDPGSSGGQSDIWRLDLLTGAMDQLTSTVDMSETSPVALLDGRILVTAFSVDLVKSRGVLQVLDPEASTFETLSSASEVVASVTLAAGETIVYELNAGEDASTGLWTRSIDTDGAPRRLGEPGLLHPRAQRGGGRVLAVDLSSPSSPRLVEVDASSPK